MFDRVTLLYSRKLTKHCKPAIMGEKIIKIKKIKNKIKLDRTHKEEREKERKEGRKEKEKTPWMESTSEIQPDIFLKNQPEIEYTLHEQLHQIFVHKTGFCSNQQAVERL